MGGDAAPEGIPAPGCGGLVRLGRRWSLRESNDAAEVACSHVSGLLVQSGWTAGPDGVREPRPHHSSGIDVPMNRQASLGCVGSTDCAITIAVERDKLRPTRF